MTVKKRKPAKKRAAKAHVERSPAPVAQPVKWPVVIPKPLNVEPKPKGAFERFWEWLTLAPKPVKRKYDF